ncbi:MAG: hypothetical protein K2H86_03550 [Muribaculaceae bacterium]|nr:hypothetical protein [Muribaculaceae bacterium]
MRETAIYGLISLLLIGLYAADMWMYTHTLVVWWVPLMLALIPVCVSWFLLKRFWKSLWPDISVCLLCAAHVVILTGFFYFLILGVNRWCADPHLRYTEDVTVAARVRETHYHTRRVNRRYSTRGTPYYTYKLDCELPDGRHKSIEVSHAYYKSVRTGSEIKLTMVSGVLGFPVILNTPGSE